MNTAVLDIEQVPWSEIGEKFRSLNSETHHEVSTFVPGGALRAEAISDTQARNGEMYERGIHSRTIYLSSVRNDSATLGHVHWLNERGSEVRTVPALPVRMIISDRKTAVLPFDPSDGKRGIVIHRGLSVVAGLQSLFEITWASATPLGLTIPTDSSDLSVEERAILELLALGRTDKEIMKVMGLSERTVARKVATILERLNAETRFEAAYKAVKKNWI